MRKNNQDSAEKRLKKLFETEGFRRLKEQLDVLLGEPVWWCGLGPEEPISILDSHQKRDCGLLQDKEDVAEAWIEETCSAIDRAHRERAGLISPSPPEKVQVITPVFCGDEILGFLGLAHLPPFEQQRLQPLLPLLGEHMRQIAERERATEDLMGVQRLWSDVVSALELEDLQDRILDEILKVLDADRGVLLLTDSNNRLSPTLYNGFDATPGKRDDYQLSAQPYEKKMQTWDRAARILSPGDPLSEWYKGISPGGETDPSVWAAPLLFDRKLYGIVLCTGRRSQSLDPYLEMSLQTLTMGSSVAIRNAQEFARMHQKAVALSTVHSVYRLLSATRVTDDLLQRMANLTIQVLNVKKCSIMLADETGRLKPRIKIGLGKGEIGSKILNWGEGIPGSVAESAAGMLVDRPHDDPRFEKDPSRFYPSESYLAVPLFADEVIGVITLAEKHNQSRFTEGDREVLNTLAEQAVIALMNIRYFEKQERIALNTMGTFENLFETGDPDKEGRAQKLATLVDNLARALKADEQTRQIFQMAAFIHNLGTMKLAELKHEEGEAEGHELKHVEMAIRMARKLDLPDAIIPILRDHHEYFDGTGDPRGLKGDEIPLGARILAMADWFLKQVYPGEGIHGLSTRQALDLLNEETGTRFDPNLVEKLREFLQVRGQEEGGEEERESSSSVSDETTDHGIEETHRKQVHGGAT